ncbi:sulfatase [Castellaniella hirudinis]|uniref:sulfatase family protein n=1 Tax=Castellaniella hirudinis TaxID=1144617 RepID=UPI0039C0A51E
MSAPAMRYVSLSALAALSTLLAACSGSDSSSADDALASAKPNILFIVVDDLGVDQLTSYGYGGTSPARTPNLTAIARAGVQFRNAWAMPDCTPTRATFFTGRYPSSTNILNALVATDLANSSTSPYEMTLPKLLKTQGYTNALIGKMHITGSDLNDSFSLPYGYDSMWKLGWDYFDGFLDGAPYNIDTRAGLSTLGDSVDGGPYKCGFIPTTRIDAANGADAGACYLADGSCSPLAIGGDVVTPGRTCMERGGILDPGQSCKASVPSYLDFTAQNGYYTGRWVKSTENGNGYVVPASDPSSRGYRSILETERALAWAKQQPSDHPWMLTVGYSAIHTPLQLPPVDLIAADTPGRNDNLVCSPLADSEATPVLTPVTDLIDSHLITNLMIEAVDKKIGDLLVGLGLAQYKNGVLDYQPEKTNTLVVVVGDNGTYVDSVKFTAPGRFDPTRAKATPYQTGVWVPLLMAGPMVASPGREVPHMIGSVDLYRLFAEIAGADVDAAVPPDRPVDAQPALAYLENPAQSSIRATNFTEMGTNLRVVGSGDTESACVIPAADNVCTTLFPQKGVCLTQGGIWYGDNLSPETAGIPAEGYHNCCQVQAYRLAQGQGTTFLPTATKAVTDGTYKLVRQTRNQCEPAMGSAADPSAYAYSATRFEVMDELYRIDTATPNPTLDRSGSELVAISAPPLNTASLTAEQQRAYDTLSATMGQHDAVASYNQSYDSVGCPGDGNRDLAVDQTDLANWQELSRLNGGQSSWYDFNHDGKTDEADRQIILKHMGMACRSS